MDVEGRPEVLRGHRRALEVPTGPAGSPRGVPGRLARLRALPQREVPRVALALGIGVGGGLHRRRPAGRTARRTPARTARRSRRRPAVDGTRAPARSAGASGRPSRGRARRARFVRRWQHAERVVRARRTPGRCAYDQAHQGPCSADSRRHDLVVDVGDVAARHRGSRRAQPAAQQSDARRRSACPMCGPAARWGRRGRPRPHRVPAGRSPAPSGSLCRTAPSSPVRRIRGEHAGTGTEAPMPGTHHYATELTWTGNTGSGTATYRSYRRTCEVRAEGKPSLAGSSDPHFRGDADRLEPAGAAGSPRCPSATCCPSCTRRRIAAWSSSTTPTPPPARCGQRAPAAG